MSFNNFVDSVDVVEQTLAATLLRRANRKLSTKFQHLLVFVCVGPLPRTCVYGSLNTPPPLLIHLAQKGSFHRSYVIVFSLEHSETGYKTPSLLL